MKKVFKSLAKRPVMSFNKLFFKAYYYFVAKHYQLRPVPELKNHRILILAPHVDDEIIGCGGYLCYLASRENIIKCLYLTNGAASSHPSMNRNELINAREEEGKKVASFFSFEEPVFLHEEDGFLDIKENTLKKAQAVIGAFAPDTIFLPCNLDGHQDHVATAGIGLAAIENAGFKGDYPLYLYSVNSPLTHYTANRYFPMGKEWDKKKEALSIFTSQTLPFEVFLTLDNCRKNALKKKSRKKSKGAEFFIKSSLEEYQKAYSLKGPEIYHYFRQISSPFNMIRYYFRGWSLKKELGGYFSKNSPGEYR